MGHARRRIIDEAIQLVRNLDVTGANVFEDPAAAIDDGKIPAAIVEAGREEVEMLGEVHDVSDGYMQIRRLSLDITVITKSATTRDDASLEVEESIMRSNIARDRRLVRVEFESNGEGATRLWSASSTFELTYLTLSAYPRINR